MTEVETDITLIFYLVCQPEIAYTKFAHQDFLMERIFPPEGKYFVPCVREFSEHHSIEALRGEIEIVNFANLPKVER